MRVNFLLAFLLNLAVVVISWAVLPERVASHFGADGKANGWSSNTAFALTMAGIQLFLFFTLYYASRWILLFPVSMINLHNKEYWLRRRAQITCAMMADIFAPGKALQAEACLEGPCRLQ